MRAVTDGCEVGNHNGTELYVFARFRRIYRQDRSTLALLKWGFGEYYQCGYWAALENRGSWLLAAARGSNPLLSAVLRDLRDVGFYLIREWFLTVLSADAIFGLVLKRGYVPYLGGLTSRLSLLLDIAPRVAPYV